MRLAGFLCRASIPPFGPTLTSRSRTTLCVCRGSVVLDWITDGEVEVPTQCSHAHLTHQAYRISVEPSKERWYPFANGPLRNQWHSGWIKPALGTVRLFRFRWLGHHGHTLRPLQSKNLSPGVRKKKARIGYPLPVVRLSTRKPLCVPEG